MVIDFNPFFDMPRNAGLLAELWRSPMFREGRHAHLPLNVSEDNDNLYIRAEVPGVALGDMEISLLGKSLEIKGERKADKGTFYRQERPAGPFNRVVALPEAVKREGIRATMLNGILEIVLPKAEEAKVRKINIETE